MECHTVKLILLLNSLVLHMCGSNGALIGDCSPQDDIPCVLYRFKGNDCFAENLKQHFAFYETNTTSFPGAPNSLDLSPGYRYNTNNIWYPEANLTFTTPQNAAMNYVKGFEINRYDISNKPTCYILDLSNVSWSENSFDKMNAQFRLDLYPLNPTQPAMFKFEAYALPKQEIKDPNFDQFLELYVQFPKYVSEGDRSPRNWKATISFTTDSILGQVHAKIVPPSPDFGFKAFEYSLYNTVTQTASLLFNEEKTSYNFTNVPSGIYQIWVKPIEGVNGCPCKDGTGQVCDHCMTTRTKEFNFTYTGLPLPPTTTTTTRGGEIIHPGESTSTPSTSPPVTKDTVSSTKVFESSTTSSEAVSLAQVLGAVFGVIGGLLLALLMLVLFYYRRHRSKKDKTLEKPEMDGYPGQNPAYADDVVSVLTYQNLAQFNSNKGEKVRFEKQPKLFLLYEDDHEHHRNVVNQFAKYLQQHCQCMVMCVEWQLDAPWVHQDLEQADYVVIVNSEGAFTTYSNKFGQRNESGNEKQSSPLNRRMSSINSVRNKFLHDERYDNIVMVYFNYTDEKYILPDICPGYKYQIPKHFTDFLLHVHKLHRTENLQKYDLPLDGNHSKRPIGQQFLESLSAAERYQQQNPNWAQKKFGYTRMYSDCSDDSKIDSGITEDFSSPVQTPQVERPAPFSNPKEAALLHMLEGKSVCTVNPSDLGITLYQKVPDSLPLPSEVPHAPKERPKLSPHSFTAEAKQISNEDSPCPPTCSTVESEFAFFPPDDLDADFDVLSKTQSEQMKSIVDRYQAVNSLETSNYEHFVNQSDRYDRNRDLLLLKVHSGEVPFIECNMNGEVVSLGGESV